MAGYSPATSEEQEGLPPPPPGADSSSSSSSNPDPRVEAEIALQEREADLSMEDLVQQQYEEPNEQELDEEVRELLQQYNISKEDADAARAVQGGQAESAGGIKGEGSPSNAAAAGAFDDLDGEELSVEQAEGRKAAILLELITEAVSGGSELDAKIAQFEDDIDGELLKMLEQRITAAAKVPGPTGAVHVEPLAELYRVLKLVYQRSTSTPALRLLDDVLFILGDDLGAETYSSRRIEAMGRMREAFIGGVNPGVDIFAAAAALAEGGPLAAAELSTEPVAVVDFLAEATSLLSDATQQQHELMASIERAQQEVQYLQKRQPQALQTPKAQAQLQQVRLAQQAHAARATSLSQLQDVVLLARELELQIKQSGSSTM
eukprot:CAMPEP_0202348920 /NCGR_PEP_ID=MMETSP1126-20121109/6631_1 /ASSEMBLY_ACC=CAM_ASM_000457 /TAXON_ID=3047 /ORGANISM="Dunaliella tertiolecta, Strain CCMP1320" /LENGTH=376 /DNA_ID=CAMNT_0048940651 /DNA_START=235 /DNA_END=1365 /DNA_ORIENTATION=+